MVHGSNRLPRGSDSLWRLGSIIGVVGSAGSSQKRTTVAIVIIVTRSSTRMISIELLLVPRLNDEDGLGEAKTLYGAVGEVVEGATCV
jgi:hypothetical protein